MRFIKLPWWTERFFQYHINRPHTEGWDPIHRFGKAVQ